MKYIIKNIKIGTVPAKSFLFIDSNNDMIAQFKIWNWWDGINVSDFEIAKKYRGRKLSYKLLDYMTKNCKVKNLAVRKDNNIAIHVYKKYGFVYTDSDDKLIYMSLK